MPILGVISSGISGHLETNSFESIATVTVGSPQSTISFTSIPATFKHLQIRAIYKSTSGSGEDYWYQYFYFNTDSAGSSYAYHKMTGRNAVAASSNGTSLAGTGNEFSEVSNAIPSSLFNVCVIDILDYANTSKNKVVRGLSGYNNTDTSFIRLSSNLWNNTAAINAITFTLHGSAGNYNANTQFALYGIRG